MPPDGLVVLTPSGDARIVCIVCVGRDPGRLVAEPTTVLIVVGDAPAPDDTEGCPSLDGTATMTIVVTTQVLAPQEVRDGLVAAVAMLG